MGLFSDACTALIDPQTGKALTGEALQKARQDPNWPRCGYRIIKKARFCSRCGALPPGGWWKCPGCGNWVGNESNYCWNCKTPLYPESRLEIAGGVWQKPGDVFARRFEVGDLKRLLEKGLHIQTGTAAILLDSGVVKDVLGPGRHNLDSLAHKINWWGHPPPRSVILLDNGDVILPLRVEGCRTAEDLPVEVYAEVCFHFVEKGAADFVANLFKNAEALSYEGLLAPLKGEIRYAADNLCHTSTMEDLFKDPQRRTQLEDALQTTLATALQRFGLEIVRVGCVDFLSPEYEALRKRSGEIEVKRRELEFDQRLRELLAGDKMQQFKTQQDLEEYVRQLAQEKQVGDEKRDHELALLRLVHRQEIGKREADFAMAQEMAQAAHQIGLKRMADQYAREAKLAEQEDEVKIAQMWLKVREEKNRQKLEEEATRAKLREGLSLQTLLSLTDDPALRNDLLRLQEQLQLQGRSAEEIIAVQAGRSPDLARALIEIQRGRREERDREWEERKRMLESTAERLERILKAALETTAEAAKRPGSSTQIVK